MICQIKFFNYGSFEKKKKNVASLSIVENQFVVRAEFLMIKRKRKFILSEWRVKKTK